MEPRPSRKTKSVDALRKCSEDPVIIMTVARMFWYERKLDKARHWFSRSCKSDSDIGDHWAWWFKFELEQGSEDQINEVKRSSQLAEPHHGDVWQSIIKSDTNLSKPFDQLLELTASKLN